MPAAPDMPPTRPLVVLVVDDDPDMRSYIRACLARLGQRVGRIVDAEDGLDALALALTQPVDLVVSDVVMPRMDGLELCAELAADPRLARIPVLLVSGELDLDRRRPEVGARILSKPFDSETLARTVRAVLDAAEPPASPTRER